MPILTGERLGPYEILSAIGAGGMGEVYQAHDTRLGRDVAIKVLPEAFAHDPERLSRFQREAKMLAALNHPNIATIYGLEQANGTSYLVMELVPGETLQQRIVREGALAVDEALAIAKQIAEALEAAHEKGIIHRDLKPANVKVTPEGKVKVLDFGLAKAFAGDGVNEDPANSPTLSMAATMHGVILGTAAYMSPEQAKGKAVDKRTDIWAFGCVLYELLTGKAAFQGEDVGDILAEVVKAEPDWNQLPEATPPAIRTLLGRCLRKDKRQRLQDASGLRIEIEDVIAAPKDSGAMQVAPAFTSKLPWAVAAAVTFIAVVTSLGWWRSTRPVEQVLRPLVRLDVDLGPDVSLGSLSEPTQSFRPTARGWSTCRKGGFLPGGSISPPPLSLQERRGHMLLSSPRTGSGSLSSRRESCKRFPWMAARQSPCAIRALAGAAVGARMATSSLRLALGGGLSRIPSAGGPPTPVTDLQNGEYSHRWPQILPGGKAVLFTASPTPAAFDGASIEVMSLADHRTKTLVRGGTYGRYLPSGHLDLREPGHAVCRTVRRGSAGSSRDASPGARPSRLQRRTGFGTD